MPDYFPDFSCKMGACRHACCEGWPVWFSLDDYFKLESLDCGKELRDLMDRGIRISLEPTPDRYAQFVPRYDGNCYMRLPDGRCALQAEFGEKALTDVCRLYPRGARMTESGAEISCSNSCEATLEILFGREKAIDFFVADSDVSMPPQSQRKFFFDTMGSSTELRLAFIKVIQNRAFPLPTRFRLLGAVMQKAEEALKNHDKELLDKIIGGMTVTANNKKIGKEDIGFGIRTCEKLISALDERSVSVREYGEKALLFYTSGENAYKNYTEAKEKFEECFPEWEVFFENMFVNYMFFSEFPFADRPEGFLDEFTALCVIYTLLRFLCIGWTAKHPGKNALIDVCAAAFRLICHTNFERRIIALTKELMLSENSDLMRLLSV